MQIENRWRTTIFCKLQKEKKSPEKILILCIFSEWWLAATFLEKILSSRTKLKLWNTQMIFMKYT